MLYCAIDGQEENVCRTSVILLNRCGRRHSLKRESRWDGMGWEGGRLMTGLAPRNQSNSLEQLLVWGRSVLSDDLVCSRLSKNDDKLRWKL